MPGTNKKSVQGIDVVHRMRGGGAALLAAVLSTLAGCAVDKGANGQLSFKVDQAELFGTQVARFAVGNDEGTLRVSNGNYSIKLRDRMKVIALAGAQTARIVRVDTVGDRTAILVERGERNCARKYQLLSIRGGDVLSWEFGDCATEAQVAAQGDDLTYDFARDRRLTRFTYRDARLLRADAVLPPPPAPPAQAPLAVVSGDRYVPGLPTVIEKPAAAPARTAAAPAPAPAARPAPRTTATATAGAAPAAAPAQKALVFPAAAEQTPIRIVLDK